ncbi:MAG: lipopolysaccharide biosynthesis protein [Fidelibacterota bacterium]
MILKKIFISSSIWILLSTVYSRILTFTVTIILAKLLVPEDFGIVAFAMLITGTISIFRELGLNRSLIYVKGDQKEYGNTAFWLILAWSAILYFLILIFARSIAAFFDESILKQILPVSSLSIIILSVTEVPLALSEKNLNFRKRILPDIIKVTTYTIITLFLASRGLAYWSIIFGNLASDIIYALSTLIIMRWFPHFIFSRPAAKKLLFYGKNIIGMGLTHFTIGHIDDTFVGKLLGTNSLGHYNFAFRIGNLLSKNLSGIFSKVLFPIYNKISHSKWDLANAITKFYNQLIIISIPVSVGMIFFLPDLITIFYDHKWDMAIIPLQLITLQGLIRSFGIPIGPFYLSIGKPGISLKISIAQLILIVILIYPFILKWQLIGVCILNIIARIFTVVAHYLASKRYLDLKYSKMLIKTLYVLAVSILIAFIISNFAKTQLTISTILIKGMIYSIITYLILYTTQHETRLLLNDIFSPIRDKLRNSKTH